MHRSAAAIFINNRWAQILALAIQMNLAFSA